MRIVPTSKTIATYCKEIGEHDAIVNHEYQRSNRIWPVAAQSFLIESILLGYPVPKLALFQITDRVTRTTILEIVDGQQRTEAILQFYNNKLRLSRNLELDEAAGRTYEELSQDLQGQFLSYGLGFDLFVDATQREIRETFRRVNAYETPLNGEEQRYARWQGEFKWFIYRLSKAHDETFKLLGTFGEKQLARMADMKLFSEISDALIYGIRTTNKRILDSLYATFDTVFEDDPLFGERIDEALLKLIDLEAIYKTSVTKSYAMYSLVLALIHAQHDVESLRSVASGGTGIAEAEVMERNLSQLADVLELDVEDVPTEFEDFYRASSKGTNVKEAREIRMKYFLQAVTAPAE